MKRPDTCPDCGSRDAFDAGIIMHRPGCAAVATPIYSGTLPTPYELEGRCWRCGGKDERDTLPGKRPRRPVCCSCAWTLIKTALDEPSHVHRFARIDAPCDICGQTASELWGFR